MGTSAIGLRSRAELETMIEIGQHCFSSGNAALPGNPDASTDDSVKRPIYLQKCRNGDMMWPSGFCLDTFPSHSAYIGPETLFDHDEC